MDRGRLRGRKEVREMKGGERKIRRKGKREDDGGRRKEEERRRERRERGREERKGGKQVGRQLLKFG